MKLFRHRRSLCLGIVVLALFVMAASLPLRAQDAPNQGIDLRFHKFQPPVSPEQAASAAAGQLPSVVTAQQIQALLMEKQSRTPAEKKIDSNVLYTMRMLLGQPAAPGIPSLYTGVDLDENDGIVVDINANVTDRLLQQLSAAGALVLYSNADFHAIRAIVPPGQIESLAASSDVIFVGRKAEMITAGLKALPRLNRAPGGSNLPKTAMPLAFELRAARIRKQLAALLQAGTNGTGQGAVTTEGDATHRAFDARGAFGVTGAGLKIGVLSDSANATGAATAAQASGDLPPTCPGPGGACLTIVQDFAGGADEGTAMMEIVHDMAPGASLFFATADVSEAGFAQNILNLQSISGCDIIVDDVFYFDEPVFQDGVVAQAVTTVTAAGVLYFSSAGNEGNVDSATAGYFEGDFNDTGSPAFTFPGGAKTGTIHNFGTVGTPVNGDIITARGNVYNLNWADPHGASTNDYDLFLVSSAGTVKASSTNIQSGTQNPYEQISPPALAAGDRLVVFKTAAAAPVLFAINTIRGRLTVATTGQTHGHSSAGGTGVYSVAATPATTAFGPGNPTGPFPNPFNTGNSVELFTSDGPRRIIFNADGSPITPGNFSSTGGVVRNKPDITGADGVSTTLPAGSGLNPFFGTSAAAPSAASVAALVKSASPSLTQSQIRATLTSTAIDIMAAGYDRDSGSGIVMAWEAINSLGVAGLANPELGTVTATENPGNGNGIIEAGEGAKLVIQLNNHSGVQNATAVTAALTTSTPGVTITQPNVSAYADMAAGTGSGNNLSPFTFTLASNAACGLTVNFTLTVNYSGPSAQSRVFTFTVQTGLITLTNVLGTTPATIPGVTTRTGTQTNRVSRSGVASTCASVKAFPGTVAAASRTFDSYKFTACKAVCLTTSLTSSNAVNIFTVDYSPSFDPTNIATNYAGDAGASGNGQSCAINTAAATDYEVVVQDVPGTATGSTYSLTLPVCAFSCNTNQVPVALAHNVTVVSATVGGTANANIDNGSSDPDGDAITLTQTPPGPYPQGATNVVLTVVDTKGATAQASATVTVVSPVPDLTIAKSHSGNFTQGLAGAYTITVGNAGTGATVGTVTVVDTLPSGLMATALSGSGWTCTLATLTCTRSDALPASSSYPAITVSVSVANNATASVTNSAVVSGGGETNTANDIATDPTTIIQLPGPPLVIGLLAPSTQTIENGNSAQFVFDVISHSASLGNIGFSCSGLPAGAACNFTPQTENQGDAQVTMTVTTTHNAGLVMPFGKGAGGGTGPVYATLLFPVLGLVSLAVAGRRGRKNRMRLLMFLGSLVVLMALFGCGGSTNNGKGTPIGAFTITVTATSAANPSVTASTQVVITVQ